MSEYNFHCSDFVRGEGLDGLYGFLGFSFAYFDCVGSLPEDLGAEAAAVYSQGVNCFVGGFVYYLHHGVGLSLDDKCGQPCDRLPGVVVGLVNGYRPAGIRPGRRVGYIDVSRPARRPCGELVAAGGPFIGVGHRQTGDLVAESIQMLAGIWRCTGLAVLSGFQRVPPSQVEVGDGRHTEGIDRIIPIVDAMVENSRQMLKAKAFRIALIALFLPVCGQPLESISA